MFDWKKAEGNEDKRELMKQMQALLFKQKEKQVADKVKKKFSSKFEEIGGEIAPGVKVLIRKAHKVGEVKEIRGKKAIVQLGIIPLTVDITDLVVVREKTVVE